MLLLYYTDPTVNQRLLRPLKKAWGGFPREGAVSGIVVSEDGTRAAGAIHYA